MTVVISAKLVKELRDRTAAGMMECKKALQEANGDIELAIDNMRKSGVAKAAKKAGRVASEGVIEVAISNDQTFGILLEVNCETDFVAKDVSFKALAAKAAKYALDNKVTDIEVVKAEFETERAELVAKIGENMTIRRLKVISGTNLTSYLHGAKKAAIVSSVSSDPELIKHIAMHVVASKPEFLTPDHVPQDTVDHEYAIQLDIAVQSGKPQEIAEKMVAGRMKKFKGEVSLTGQAFVMDPSKTVEDVLKEKNTSVDAFIALEVGEGVEKVETNFADEVAAMTKSF
ncbi:MAG: translation elongation factor Ts [Psittacicella sp.]